MKKLVMTAAVLTCAASIVSAQTVTSANVVGYNKKAVQAGLQMHAMQFVGDAAATPTGIFGTSLPLGSQIFIWDNNGAGAGSYTVATFIQPPFPPGAASKWDSDPEIGLGAGFWVQSPGGSPDVENIVSGEILLAASTNMTIQLGLQLISNPYPYDVLITDLGLTPTVGDKLFVWTNNGAGGGAYGVATYIQPPFPPGAASKWDDEAVVIQVGQGLWYQSANASDTTLTWVAPAGL